MPRTATAMSRICCGRKTENHIWIHSIFDCLQKKLLSFLLGKSPPNAAGFFLIIKIGYVRMDVITFMFLQIGIIPQQLIQTTSECDQNQCVDEKELDDVDNHAAERHLQRSQMRIYRKYVNQFEKREYHASSEHTFRHQNRVIWIELFAWIICIQAHFKFTLQWHRVKQSHNCTELQNLSSLNLTYLYDIPRCDA